MRATIAAGALAGILLFGGAAFALAPHAASPPASVNVPAGIHLDRLVREHPFYAGVLQDERAIAALRASLSLPAFADATARMNASLAALRRDLGDEATHIALMTQHRADDLARAQDEAAAALLAQQRAGRAPEAASVRNDVERRYREQYAHLRNDAQGSMAAYRATIAAQTNHDYRAYTASVQRQTERAYAARAQQFHEKEATLALDLAKADAGRRLPLQARLRTLYLRPERRKALSAELHAVDAAEKAKVDALRRRNDAELRAYQGTLRARAGSELAGMAAQLQARTQSNLAARRDAMVAQIDGAPQLALGAGAPDANTNGGAQAQLQALRSRGAADIRAQAHAIAQAFQNARSDLPQRLSAQRDRAVASRAGALAQIASLQQDEASLRAQIANWIAQDAQRHAGQGLRGHALAAAVEADIRTTEAPQNRR